MGGIVAQRRAEAGRHGVDHACAQARALGGAVARPTHPVILDNQAQIAEKALFVPMTDEQAQKAESDYTAAIG